MRLALGFAALLLVACGPRAVLGGHATEPSTVYGPPGADLPSSAFPDPALPPSVTRPPPPDAVPAIITVSASSVATTAEPRSGIVISRLPAPHRVAAADSPAPRTVADALALAGHRDPRDPLAFALAVAASLGTAPVPALRTGPALVAWAREQGSFVSLAEITSIAPGDLLVFDRAVENLPASLVAVALTTDARGVTSFLYVARGVIRIGHLDPARPKVARDREGKTVNSYLRHTSDYPPAGTRYLAGELLAGRIRP